MPGIFKETVGEEVFNVHKTDTLTKMKNHYENQEKQLQEQKVPLNYWTYVIRNYNDKKAWSQDKPKYPNLGVVVYSKQDVEDVIQSLDDVQYIDTNELIYDIHCIDGRDISHFSQLTRDILKEDSSLLFQHDEKMGLKPLNSVQA